MLANAAAGALILASRDPAAAPMTVLSPAPLPKRPEE